MPGLARKPLPKPNPDSDPRYRKVMEQLKAGAAKTKAHVPAAKKAGEASAAAKGPPNERLATGKAQQVDKIKEAKEGKPEPSSFLEILQAEIAKAMPKTLGDTENFDQTAQQMKGGLKGNISQQKENSTKDVSGASKQAPAPAGEATAGGAVPGEPAPGAPPINAPEGMPAPKSDADVSLQDSKQDTDAQMKDAEVTPQQLQKANDPRFSAVLDAKTQVARQADTAPAQYHGQERATLNKAAAGAQADTRRGAAAMIGVRGGSNVRVLTRQQQQKAADEAARAKVVAGIEQIYSETKEKVDQKLASLDIEVGAMFDQGTDAALNAMTTFVNALLDAYKKDRYSSLIGKGRWLRDKWRGLPDDVNVFYEQGREVFQKSMNALVVRVAALVERRLKEAKDEVAKGQATIKDFVDKQPTSLRDVAKKAQQDVSTRFAELERGIEDKKNQLAQALAAKYKEAFNKANEALQKIQDENKGFVAGFIGKLVAVIKALLEFKDKLMSILRKGVAAIKLIIADPIGFLSNLISAVAGGIQQFKANIKKHMANGFSQWLFGSLGGLGIEVPRDLSLPSILKLVLSVLGIPYDRIRAKAAQLLGDRNMHLVEKLIEYVRTLVSEGPAALWEYVKGDLSSLKEMVIDTLEKWVIETAAKQGIARIVALFNPVGAIIAAIMAIYNIIMFVVEQASEIAAFVESVVDSVYDIASGNISGAVKKIESSLAKAIPLLIGFLARFAGLGNITEKIQEFINNVREKVHAAIDRSMAKIVEVVKKLFGKDGKKTDDNRTEAEKRQALHQGVSEATALLQNPEFSPVAVTRKLEPIKQKHKLTRLAIVVSSKTGAGETDYIEGEVNPIEQGSPSTKPTEMPEEAIDFKCKKDLNETEFKRQVKMQQEGINAMKIARWHSNRVAFFARKKAAAKTRVNPEGRDPAGLKIMADVREKAIAALATKIMSETPGMSYANARASAVDRLKDQVPLHTVDQIAGGEGTDVRELGGERENSSIGAAWRSRAAKLEAIVLKLSEDARNQANMRVKLTVNGQPV